MSCHWIYELNVKLTLLSIRKGSSLCPNPFKGFTLRNESFKGLKGVGDQTAVSWSALLCHHPVPIRSSCHHGKNQRKGSWEPEVSIKSFIPKGPLKATFQSIFLCHSLTNFQSRSLGPCPKWHPKPSRSSSESALSWRNAALTVG